MKTLRIIARLNIGGPARHAVILDAGLRDRGVETLLVYGQVADGEAALEDCVGARRLRAVKVPELGRRVRVWSDLRAFARLLHLVFAERPDVVHTHTAKAGALGRLAACVFNATRPRRKRCLVVHTFHGHVLSGYFGPVVSHAIRLTERLLARATDCIITISPSQKAEIVDKFRIADTNRVRVVPLGLELDDLLALPPARPGLRADLGIEDGAVVFGYVGRLVPIKDLPTLLHAFAIAWAQVPSLRLVIVGDGPLKTELQRLADTLGLGAVVRFAGWQRDLSAVYSTFDVTVLSSRNEGTPVTLIEAMAAGCPVIATRVGGVPDVVVSGETGILVPPGEATAMADALVRLAKDGGERRRLAAAARPSVARYQPSRLIADILDIYTSGVAAKRRAKV